MKKGFVLGCLFSLVIVVLLVAILFAPSCACGGREAAREAGCISNERQIGLGLLEYADDNDQQLPTGLHGSGIGWAGQVQPYTKSPGVFHCPDDPGPANLIASSVSYGYNFNSTRRRGKLRFFDQPAKTVLAFETAGGQAYLGRTDEGAAAGAKEFSAAADGTDGSLRAGKNGEVVFDTGYLGRRPVLAKSSQFEDRVGRHSDGSNFILADGHVKWFLPGSVSSGSDALHAGDAQSGSITGPAAGTSNPVFEATFSTR